MQRFLCLLLCLFVVSQPIHATIDDTVDELCNRVRETKSDAVLITHNGKIIFEYLSDNEDNALDLLSATSSIASLAIGMLESEGKLCLDTPISEYYPEWNQGIKKQITIRHILSNTSGIQADFCPKELYRLKNIIQIALCAGTSHIPGDSFYYNPKALNLLSGIVQKITGMNLGEFLEIKLFSPLGIEDASWLCDGLGTTFFHSHLSLPAHDLAKIGEMLVNEGCYRGKRIISKEWIDQMIRPSQTLDPFFGFQWQLDFYSTSCWWDENLLNEYSRYGVDKQFVLALKALCGRVIEMPAFSKKTEGCHHFDEQVIRLLGGIENTEKFCEQVQQCHLPLANWKVGSLMSYEAVSHSGQQLIVIPDRKVVAVRLVHSRDCCGSADPFSDFRRLVGQLTYGMGK